MTKDTMIRTINAAGRIQGDIAVHATMSSRDEETAVDIFPISRASEVFATDDKYDLRNTAHMPDVLMKDGRVAHPVIIHSTKPEGFLPAFYNPETEELTVHVTPHACAASTAEIAYHLADDFVNPKNMDVINALFKAKKER
jgi:hypothetical protein